LAAEGWTSIEWVESGLREALHKDGRRWLESLLNDPTLPIPGDASQPGEKCTAGVPCQVNSIFGTLTLRRNYYHDAQGRCGRYPLDTALDLVAGYTPMLGRLMTRAGAQSGYETASEDLRVYGGIKVSGRQIHRLLQVTGPQMQRALAQAQPEAVGAPVPVFYVSVDGTGAPMVPAALEGRKGKQPDGSAKTREVKLGCVFTQHRRDEQGCAVRDPDSTTYLCGLETAGDFGSRLRHEAFRRGMGQSEQTVVLGDGATWIWELARVNFGHATQILDYYHAREHLTKLVHALVRQGTPAAQRLLEVWETLLWEGQIDLLLRRARRKAQGVNGLAHRIAGTELNYFDNNRQRMRYAEFRRAGFFIGSGVVEAGCKTVIGQRAKQSGMKWTEAGLLNVLNPRCALMGGQFDDCWERRRTAETS
jgi:nucleotide-binding universal stress UspA family protein